MWQNRVVFGAKTKRPPQPVSLAYTQAISHGRVPRSLILSLIASLAMVPVYFAAGQLLDGLLPGGGTISAATWVLIALGLLGAVVGNLWAIISGQKAQGKLETELRIAVSENLAERAAVDTQERSTGAELSTATDAVERVAAYRATFLGSIIGSMLAPVLIAIVVAVFLDTRSGLWLLLGVPLVPFLIGGFQSAFRRVSAKYRVSSRALSAYYLDSIQGLTELRTYGSDGQQQRELDRRSEDVRQRVMAMLAGNQLIVGVGDLTFSLAMLVLGGYLALTGLDAGAITVGGALSLVLLANAMTEPLDKVGQFFYIGMGGIAANREVRAQLSLPDDDAAPASPATQPAEGPLTAPGSVVLQGVGFRYGPDLPPVLADFNLTVSPGERIGVVGPSGVGKTTVIELLLGTRQAQSGTVLVNGIDPGQAGPAGMAGEVAAVRQLPQLFSGSVAYNLRVAHPEAKTDELWRVLDQVGLREEIAALPDGLDTEVGERGLHLSGGQAQRLALARALLSGAPVLVLDEPTAQVDLAGEAKVVRAIANLPADRTVITIAHRATALVGTTRTIELATIPAAEAEVKNV